MKKCIYNVDGEIIRDYENRPVKKPKSLCTIPMSEYIACFPDEWSWKECDEWFYKDLEKNAKEIIQSFTALVDNFKMVFANETYND